MGRYEGASRALGKTTGVGERGYTDALPCATTRSGDELRADARGGGCGARGAVSTSACS